MEDPGVSERYVDPFAADEERLKWQKRLTFALVIVIRVIVKGLIFVLKMFKAVFTELMRTFKLIP
jgi:hypothetical protein